MRNHALKSPYVDVSYGWQSRNEALLLQGRRRRWVVLGGVLMLVLPVVAYLAWRLV